MVFDIDTIEASMKSTMTFKGRFVLVVGLVLVLAALIIGRTAEAQNAPQQAPKVVKWEYTDGANLNIAQMNALG